MEKLSGGGKVNEVSESKDDGRIYSSSRHRTLRPMVTRDIEAHWQKYAEHDILQYLKDIEDIPEECRGTECADVSF